MLNRFIAASYYISVPNWH